MPVALLFAMSWLAVMAMGVVECVGMCWEKSMQKRQRRRRGELDGRILFDEGLLEEVVIEAVPMDEDDEDEDYEDGGDGYGMLKKV